MRRDRSRRAGPGFLLLGCAVLATAWSVPHGAHAAGDESGHRVIVRFRSEGPHALEACAERLFRERRPFARSTRDGSRSLDDVNERIGARTMRALFRRSDGRTLAAQRAAWRDRIARRLGATGGGGAAVSALPDLVHVYTVEIGDDVSPADAVALYERDPHVVWAQPDHANVLDGLPDDPYLASSGSWGQPYADLWGLHRIRAPEAWALSEGEGVVVAVVDTGLDYDHPDIADNVWINPGEDLDGNGRVDPSDLNGIDDDDNGFVDDLRGYDFANSRDTDRDGQWDGPGDVIDPDPFDDHGHGTHVSGTIAAVADNGIGIAGVAPRARIMALKGFTGSGVGIDSVLWRAVVYAAENGARVVNNSWSCLPECPENPLAEEVVDLVHAMGVAVVTSAGNQQRDVVRNSPESSNKVITVASSGEDDAPSASFTNFGWLLDVAAPGGGPSVVSGIRVARRNILSLRSSGDPGATFVVGGDYLRNAGTSMASPHVAGVVALLLANRPDLSTDALRRIVRETAEDLGPPGHDRLMGAGRLDALAALEGASLPDLHAAFTGPRPGATFVPADGPIVVRGRASGADLLEWQLSYGRGNDPELWAPIAPPSGTAVHDDLLVAWDARDRPAGAYVLRLDVRGRDGSQYEEFLPISLEHARFEAVSSPGPDAVAPDVAGDWAVWQSRRGTRVDAFGRSDLELFASDLRTGAVHRLQSAPGDQRLATIAAWPPIVSWVDDRDDPGAPAPWACAFDPATGACPGIPLAPGALVRQPVASAAGRSVWLEDFGGRADLRACRMDPSGAVCRPEPLGLAPALRARVETDGRRLVWTEFADGLRFGSCRLRRDGPGCGPVATTAPIPALSRGAVSGDLLAWVGFDLRGDHPLQICELDPETGDCDPVVVATGVFDETPDLSGNRLVWDHHVEGEDDDVFFCEFDAVRRRCPVQRLTAQMGVQRESSIDRRRVVWEDDREGPVRVYAARLPGLARIRDRHVREGAVLVVPIRVLRAPRPRTPPPRLEAELADGRPVEALGMRFVDGGRGRGWLRWRPGPGRAGRYAVTFAATTHERLVTRHTMRIEVVAPPPRRPPTPYAELLERLHERLPGRRGATAHARR
jgi:subtilisin family serine protease